MNGTCEGVAPHMRAVVESPGVSLYCFSVYTAETGSEKPSHELELLQMQHSNAWNIFSCTEWAVFSDVVAPLGDGDMTIRVEDARNDFHFAKRKEAKTWINTGMFVQVWTAVRDGGHALNHNWIVKADADAVFFPSKLIDVLRGATVPAEGVYIENCKFVDWGYFGNLEVFSKQAFATMVNNLDTCYSSLPWKVGVHGPVGGSQTRELRVDSGRGVRSGPPRWPREEQEVYPDLRWCIRPFYPSLQEARRICRLLERGKLSAPLKCSQSSMSLENW